MKIRIDKYLADMGAGSRTEIKDDIRKGLVYINGNKVKSAGEKADTLNDEVAYKENIINILNLNIYFLISLQEWYRLRRTEKKRPYWIL